MKINLKSLTITNFKGIQSFTCNLNHITNVFGDNATGKTTVFDAFLWLFFGKNSEDVSQFEIKRLDSNNKFIKNLESEVKAVIHLDQQEVEVKKVLKQKWVRTRGETEAKYAGDENVYFWNDVPLKESEFKVKISGIVEENLFKLITNPFYFNTIKWNDRRHILVGLAGDISNDEILDTVMTPSNKGQFSDLITALNAGKTIEEFRKEIVAKKKKIKDEAEGFAPRIDEVHKGKPDTRDFNTLRNDLAIAQEDLNVLQRSMNDESTQHAEEGKRRSELMAEHNKKVTDLQQTIFNIRTRMQNIEYEAKQKAKDRSGKIDAQITSLSRQLSDKKLDLGRYTLSVTNLEHELKDEETKLQTLRESYIKRDEDQFTFDESSNNCPTCKQVLPEEEITTKVETLRTNFNKKKLDDLQGMINASSGVKQVIEGIQERINNGRNLIQTLNGEIATLDGQIVPLQTESQQLATSEAELTQNILSADEEYQRCKSDLEIASATVYTAPEFQPLSDNNEMQAKRDAIINRIYGIQKELNDEELIKKADARIAELRDQESKLAQELADLEGTEFAIQLFAKAEVDTIERRINGMFQYVRFKLFKEQNNGGENPCCDTLVNSNGSFVPFNDANNAAKINSGIDIINTLCRNYNVYAPIFIDNRESVTKLIDSESQIVNLIVSEQDKSLRIA